MSTRATYQFINKYSQNICFYIHYDGYLEGAAQYFWNMHAHKNKRGGYASRFFRGNELAEFTISHGQHEDTEYQYTLNTSTNELIVLNRPSFDNVWKEIYKGTWYDLVNQYIGKENQLILFKDDCFSSSTREEPMTIVEAQNFISENLINAFRICTDEGLSGTAQSYLSRANSMQMQIEKLFRNIK